MTEVWESSLLNGEVDSRFNWRRLSLNLSSVSISEKDFAEVVWDIQMICPSMATPEICSR